MLAFLASQMARLRRANGMPASSDEDQIAVQLETVFDEVPEEGFEVVHSRRRAVTEDGVAPARAPRPPRRFASIMPPRRPGSGGTAAPARAPMAPRRPG